MDYTVKNISDIELEGTHALPNSRQTLLTNEEIATDNFHAFTKGILPSGKVWDWHEHDEIFEFFVVIQGSGEIFFQDDTIHAYTKGDVISINPGFKHKIVAGGNEASEFYFVRVS